MCSFYVRVLGFERQPRPPFPFGGAWLSGGGLTLHLIDDDPTIPHALGSWQVGYPLPCPTLPCKLSWVHYCVCCLNVVSPQCKVANDGRGGRHSALLGDELVCENGGAMDARAQHRCVL